MELQSVTCAYRFTPTEYKQAMRGYWRTSPAFLILLVVFLVSGVAITCVALSAGAAIDSVLSNFAPILVFVGLMAFLTFVGPAQAFRRSSACNQDISYTLTPQGYHAKTPLTAVDIAWAAVPRWKECPQGFRIYLENPRAFHWLPKSGFASIAAIDWAREMMRANIKEKKKPFAFGPLTWLYLVIFLIVVVPFLYTSLSNWWVRRLDEKATALEGTGQYPEAQKTRVQAWKAAQTFMSKDRQLYAWTESGLANNYRLMGQYDRAAPLFADALKLQQAQLTADNPDTIFTLNCYSVCSFDMMNYDKAADLADNAYHLARQRFGADGDDTLISMNNLALADSQLDKSAEAEKLWTQVLETQKRLYGPGSTKLALTLGNLANLYYARDENGKALVYYQQAYDLDKKNLGDHPDTAFSEYCLAVALQEAGKTDEARAALQDCLRIREKFLGPDHKDTIETQRRLQSLDAKPAPPSKNRAKGISP